MIERKEGLWYVSQPSRLGGSRKEEYREEVLQDLITRGYDVIHPFNAFPYHHFEGNPAIGRDPAMEYCCNLVDFCDGKIIVTGVSEGVLKETEHAISNWGTENVHLFLDEYDPNWKEVIRDFKGEPEFVKSLGHLATESASAIDLTQPG